MLIGASSRPVALLALVLVLVTACTATPDTVTSSAPASRLVAVRKWHDGGTGATPTDARCRWPVPERPIEPQIAPTR